MLRSVLLVFALLASSAQADIRRNGQLQSYRISFADVTSVKIFVYADLRTTDSCNRYDMKGDLLSFDSSSAAIALYKTYLADFVVVNTLKDCPALRQPRRISLSDQNEIFADEFGDVNLNLLVPEKFQVKVVPVP
jgi:hypothetical protein